MEKSILITGCSSGIGLNSAILLKQKGYRVFATARKEQDVKHLQADGFEAFLLDVSNSESIRIACDAILSITGGTLYALFNNAGLGFPGAIEDLTRTKIREQFETNVFGPMELIQLLLPVMLKQGYGRIVQNCSMLSFVSMPFRGAYNASKYALEGFSNTLRIELRNTPVRVSILEPGPILSRFRLNSFQNYKNNPPNKRSRYQEVYDHMQSEIIQGASDKLPFMVKPDKLVKKLLHALESNHPRAHYYIGLPSNLFAILRRILPDVAFDWCIATACKQEMRWQSKNVKG